MQFGGHFEDQATQERHRLTWEKTYSVTSHVITSASELVIFWTLRSVETKDLNRWKVAIQSPYFNDSYPSSTIWNEYSGEGWSAKAEEYLLRIAVDISLLSNDSFYFIICLPTQHGDAESIQSPWCASHVAQCTASRNAPPGNIQRVSRVHKPKFRATHVYYFTSLGGLLIQRCLFVQRGPRDSKLRMRTF